MKTETQCKRDEYCPYCKTTGGEIPEGPQEWYCTVLVECQDKDKNCLYRQHLVKR